MAGINFINENEYSRQLKVKSCGYTLLPTMPCDMCNGSGGVVEIELERQCCYQPTKYGGCCGNAVPIQVEVEYPCPKCEGKKAL